jgi:hypothetical protein
MSQTTGPTDFGANDDLSQTTGPAAYNTTNGYSTTTAQPRRISTETKAAVKTTELIAYVLVTIAVLVAAQVSEQFGAKDAWFFVTLLTAGYLISRGLAKSGSRDFYDDDNNTSA